MEIVGGSGAYLHQRDIAPVARNAADIGTVVLEDDAALIIVGVIGVDVEHLRVALVARHPESLADGAPADEVRLHLFIRSQVPHGAVGGADIDMVELVPALVDWTSTRLNSSHLCASRMTCSA